MPNVRIDIIPQSKMFDQAGVSVLRASMEKLSGLEGWETGAINRTPLVIYDMNGMPLFYDFSVRKGAAGCGTVRMSASRILGSPLVSIELGARGWSPANAIEKIKPGLLKKYPGSKILSAKVVCYSYPKIGIKFDLEASNHGKQTLIYDVSDFQPVPQVPVKQGIEGRGVWSYYESIAEGEYQRRAVEFNSEEKANESVLEILSKQKVGLSYVSKALSAIDISKLKLSINVVKKLPFCSHYNYNETRSHHCFVLHAQQKNDYCAVATCQMVLCFYRYYYSQDAIAPALGYSSGGGCPSDQSPGYESLSNNHIDATYDTSATWDEAKNQINDLHPMKSGIPGHARACAGYSYTKWLFPYALSNKKLLIYDPWPWNADYKAGGAVYWENWDSVTHTNFVYTKLKY